MSQRWPERTIPSVTNRFIDWVLTHPRIILVALALLAFAPSLGNLFALDDYANVAYNPQLKSWVAFKHAFWEPSFPGNLWRPVTLTVNGAIVGFFGSAPLPHHILNLILHCFVTILLFEALRAKLPFTFAWASAGLWSVLPIHAEVVANVTGRAELLAAAFGLLAVNVALKSGKPDPANPRSQSFAPAFIPLITLLLLCSSFAKESGLVWIAPTIVVSKGSRCKHVIASGTTLFLYAFLRWNVLGAHLATNSTTNSIDNPLVDLGIGERIVWGISLLGRYIYSCIIPLHLSADYSYGAILPSNTALQPWVYLGVLLVAGTLVSRQTTGRWGLLWFLFAFAPTSNILIPIGTIFGERLVYGPSMGIIVALLTVGNSRLFFTSLVPMILIYISFAWHYSLAWRDNTALFTHQYLVSSASAKTRLNYGIVLRNLDRTEEAQTILREVYDTVPNFPEAAFAIATVYIAKGITTGAEHWLNTALSLNPNLVPALESLGRLYLNRGENSQAIRLFDKALALDPTNIRAKVGLYAIRISEHDLLRTKQLEEELASTAGDNAEFLELRKQSRD